MPRPAAAGALTGRPAPALSSVPTNPDQSGPAGAEPAPPPSPFVTRFPLAWLRVLTPDHLRAVTLVGDYARGRHGYCWAADRTIADGLELHPDTVGAGLRAAEQAGIIQAVQRPGGTSARRLVLPEGDDADQTMWVCVSAYARNTLSGARYAAYSVLALRQHLDEPTSMEKLAKLGGIGASTARAAVAELVSDGWITRTSASGRAARYAVHPAPIPGVATQLTLDIARPRQTKAPRRPAEPAPVRTECDGQIALFDPADLPLPPSGSTVTTPSGSTATTPAGSAGRTRSLQQDLVNKPATVRGCGAAVGDTSVPRDARAPEAARTLAAAAPRRIAAAPDPRTTTPTLPPLLVSPAIAAVLAEVGDLVARMTRWEQREAARAVGAAIREADGDVDRVAERLVRRRAMDADLEIRSAYGWLTERGIRRRGCDRPECESGTDTTDYTPCVTCALHLAGARDRAAARRALPRPRTAPEAAPAAAAPALAPVPGPARCGDHPAITLPCPLCVIPHSAPGPATDGRALRAALAARRTGEPS